MGKIKDTWIGDRLEIPGATEMDSYIFVAQRRVDSVCLIVLVDPWYQPQVVSQEAASHKKAFLILNIAPF